MKRDKYLIIDLGSEMSVCSSLFLAKAFAKVHSQADVHFLLAESNMHLASEVDGVKAMAPEDELLNELEFSCAVDFTEPGAGVGIGAQLPFNVENYHIDGIQLDLLNGLTDKLNFINTRFGIKICFEDLHNQVKMKNAVMTYSASLAANLNLQGIPTIELCRTSKKYGSFFHLFIDFRIFQIYF